MLAFTEKLTLDIRGMNQADVQALRDAGFSDRAIHDIALIASYFNFVNRMADGLGIVLEDFEPNEATRDYQGS